MNNISNSYDIITVYYYVCRRELQDHQQQICEQYYDNECHWCDAPLLLKKDMAEHVSEYHPHAERFKCKDCSRKFDHRKFLFLHRQKCHIAPKPFSCSHCGKTFRNKGRVKIHELTHTGERPFVCEHCGKDYVQLAHLYTHIAKHKKMGTSGKGGQKQGKEVLFCELCTTFQSTSVHVLGTHLRTQHGEEGAEVHKYLRSLYCHKCNLFFDDTMERRIHLRSHLPFECNFCNKFFANADTYASHMRMHKNNTVRPYECDVSIIHILQFYRNLLNFLHLLSTGMRQEFSRYCASKAT